MNRSGSASAGPDRICSIACSIVSSAVVSVAPGHVVTQNPAGGEEPGEMPRAGAVQQLFVFDLDHPSRWKSCCERPTSVKVQSALYIPKGQRRL